MSFEDRDGKIWMDGNLVDWREAKIHILTHTFHYGVGVFEGLRAYETPQGSAIFRLPCHLERFAMSAKIMGMPMPFSQQQLFQATVELIAANRLGACYIRPVAYYGAESMGIHAQSLATHVSIAAWEWGAYLGEDALKKGIRVKTSSFSRHYPNSAMMKAKANGQYTNSVLATQEVTTSGYDEALMLDTNGCVAEGSGQNIFIVRKGRVYTPTLTSALEGITRDTIIKILSEELSLQVVEKTITRDEIYTADEAFFTGTATEVTPICELDDRSIGAGTAGPVSQAVQELYFDIATGKHERHQDWLTLV